MRSPICCVIGHVDVGKTSFLDILRKTNVAPNESGGITQNISGWNLWRENIEHYLDKVPGYKVKDDCIPGILMLDTPGHDAFDKLRTEGVSLCDIALLIIDITKGIQKTTIESIHILNKSNTRFVIILNKVDKIDGWVSDPHGCFYNNLNKQSKDVVDKYYYYINSLMTQFQNMIIDSYKKGKYSTRVINYELHMYYDKYNTKNTKNITAVPMSSKTGEGLSDLLSVLFTICEKYMSNKLQINNELKGVIMDRGNNIKGFGMYYDVIIINGKLSKSDEIIVSKWDSEDIYTVKHTFTNQGVDDIIGCQIGKIVLSNPKNNYIYPGSIISCTDNYKKRIMRQNIYKKGSIERKKYDTITVYRKPIKPYLFGYGYGYRYGRRENDSEYKRRVAEYEKKLEEYYEQMRGRVWLHAPSHGGLDALHKLLKYRNIPIAGCSTGNTITKKNIIAIANQGTSILANFGAEVSSDIMKFAHKENIDVYTEHVVYSLVNIVIDVRSMIKKSKG